MSTLTRTRCERQGSDGGLRTPLQPLADEQKEALQRIVTALKEEVSTVIQTCHPHGGPSF
jgi:hypothetical protein